mmetsp:Transcript_7888/g.18805  ORF Transcript_7888/g.18805 Transcript_7888/m.18805 type:complete len:128 (-) Transcript_7888:404-787(-)
MGHGAIGHTVAYCGTLWHIVAPRGRSRLLASANTAVTPTLTAIQTTTRSQRATSQVGLKDGGSKQPPGMTLQLRFAQDPSAGATQGAAVQGGDSLRDIEVASSLKQAAAGSSVLPLADILWYSAGRD